MNTLVSTEVLRLRTIRSPRYLGLGVLGVMAILTAAATLDSAGGPRATPAEIADGMRSLTLMSVLIAAAFAATTVGTEFKRGAAGMSYLVEPRRERVTLARTLTYAGLGGLFAAAAAGTVIGIGLPLAAHEHLDVDLTTAGAIRAILGAGVGGAALGAAGALLGTLTRNPTIASGAIVGWNVAEGLLDIAGVGPYLPFGLVNTLIGLDPEMPAVIAGALLLAYLAGLWLIVRTWALPRDLT